MAQSASKSSEPHWTDDVCESVSGTQERQPAAAMTGNDGFLNEPQLNEDI